MCLWKKRRGSSIAWISVGSTQRIPTVGTPNQPREFPSHVLTCKSSQITPSSVIPHPSPHFFHFPHSHFFPKKCISALCSPNACLLCMAVLSALGNTKGPCSWEAYMAVLFLSHLSVLQAPLNVCETQIPGPPPHRIWLSQSALSTAPQRILIGLHREVASKLREDRGRRDKIGLRDWGKASWKRNFQKELKLDKRQAQQVLSLPNPEGKGKTLGHIPPIEGLWSIWGEQETLGQGDTLIS